MIDRIARAICEELNRTAADQPTTGRLEYCRSLASKALFELREPEDEMADAGAELIPGHDPAIHREVAKDVWRAMIDQALARSQIGSLGRSKFPDCEQ